MPQGGRSPWRLSLPTRLSPRIRKLIKLNAPCSKSNKCTQILIKREIELIIVISPTHHPHPSHQFILFYFISFHLALCSAVLVARYRGPNCPDCPKSQAKLQAKLQKLPEAEWQHRVLEFRPSLLSLVPSIGLGLPLGVASGRKRRITLDKQHQQVQLLLIDFIFPQFQAISHHPTPLFDLCRQSFFSLLSPPSWIFHPAIQRKTTARHFPQIISTSPVSDLGRATNKNSWRGQDSCPLRPLPNRVTLRRGNV